MVIYTVKNNNFPNFRKFLAFQNSFNTSLNKRDVSQEKYKTNVSLIITKNSSYNLLDNSELFDKKNRTKITIANMTTIRQYLMKRPNNFD